MQDEIKDAETSSHDFAKTAAAAKMSGIYNETAGFIKRKFGELTEDLPLQDAGRSQELLGKIHHLIGSLRSVKESTLKKLRTTRVEVEGVCRKHGGRLLDVGSEFVEDLKKTLFK